MLVQRLRRWANIKPALDQRLLLTEACLRIQVNGVEMIQKSQNDAVGMLRNVKQGSVVKLVVSRQVVDDDKLPRELVSDHNRSARTPRPKIYYNNNGVSNLQLFAIIFWTRYFSYIVEIQII